VLQVNLGGGRCVPPVRGDGEADARRQQDDGVGGADDVKLPAACLHAEGRIGVIRPWCEGEPCRPGAGQHPDQAGDAFRGGLKIVGHGDVSPPGFHDHGAVHVPLAQHPRRLDRFHGEVPGGVAAQDVGKEGAGVRQGVAHPADLGLGRHQRRGGAVPDHGVPFQADGVLAEKPGPAQFEEDPENPRERFRILQAVFGRRRQVPHPQPHVRAAERGHGQLVAHGITRVQRRAHTQPGPQVVQGIGLGGLDHGQVQDGTVHNEEQSEGLGNLLRLLGALDHVVRGGGPGVDRDRHGLPFDADSLVGAHRFEQRLVGLLKHRLGGQGQSVRESHVELRSVRAHQVDLGGKPGDRGEVTQGPSGNDGGVRVGQGGQGPKGDGRAA
jgi:hypothetical protein